MPLKKILYILLTMVLCMLLSFLAHVFILLQVFGYEPAAPWLLPVWAWVTIKLSGIACGWFLGHTWWRIVYIEHRHWRWK